MTGFAAVPTVTLCGFCAVGDVGAVLAACKRFDAIDPARVWTALASSGAQVNFVVGVATSYLKKGDGFCDVRRFRSGVNAAPVRAALLRELVLRKLPQGPWIPTPECPTCPEVAQGRWGRLPHQTTAEIVVAEGQVVVAGSYALWEYMRRTEPDCDLDWEPGDVDVWFPNRFFPSFLESHIEARVATDLPGCRMVHQPGQPSTNPYMTNIVQVQQLSLARVAKRAAVMYEYLNSRPFSSSRGGVGCQVVSCKDYHITDLGDESPEEEGAPFKISLLGTMPQLPQVAQAGGSLPQGAPRPVTARDIVDRFDIDVCKVAMSIDPISGRRDFVLADGVADAIRTRRATARFFEESRDRTIERLAKYRARGFTVGGDEPPPAPCAL